MPTKTVTVVARFLVLSTTSTRAAPFTRRLLIASGLVRKDAKGAGTLSFHRVRYGSG